MSTTANMLRICANLFETQEAILHRALEIVESAYRCPEWLQAYRTAESDEVLELVRKALKVTGHDLEVQ